MTIPPANNILIVGNRETGKTTYIYRVMGEVYSPLSVHNYPENDTSPLVVYNINESTRVIELNDSCITLVPDQYAPFITKILVFGSFDDEDSLYDVRFHVNNHVYLNVPIDIVINKKDLRDIASSSAIESLNMIDTTQHTIHYISAKYDGNILDLFQPPNSGTDVSDSGASTHIISGLSRASGWIIRL